MQDKDGIEALNRVTELPEPSYSDSGSAASGANAPGSGSAASGAYAPAQLPSGPNLQFCKGNFVAADDKDPDHFHWRREVWTWDLVSLFDDNHDWWSAKVLYQYFLTLPIVIRGRKRGHDYVHTYRAIRKQEMQETVAMATSWLTTINIPVPTNATDMRNVVKELGKYLAGIQFLTKNPRFVMDLPIVPGHDEKSQMQWRATFDERLTFPIDALPIELRTFFSAELGRYAVAVAYYRCTGEIWLGEWAHFTSPTAAEGAGEAKGVNPDPKAAAGATGAPVIPPGGGYLECGMVMSSSCSWVHKMMGKHNRHGRNSWTCRYCSQRWLRKNHGSRFVAIYDGVSCVQLILDEPPEAEYNEWVAERCEYYMRLEPNEAPRDELPLIPKVPGTHRLRLEDSASEAVWKVLYKNPDAAAIMKLDALATQAIARASAQAMEIPRVQEPTRQTDVVVE